MSLFDWFISNKLSTRFCMMKQKHHFLAKQNPGKTKLFISGLLSKTAQNRNVHLIYYHSIIKKFINSRDNIWILAILWCWDKNTHIQNYNCARNTLQHGFSIAIFLNFPLHINVTEFIQIIVSGFQDAIWL